MKTIFAILIVFGLIISHANASDIAQIGKLPTVWDNKYGDEMYAYEKRATAFSPTENTLYIAGIYSSYDRNKKNIEGIWVWKINANGEKTADLKVNEIQGEKLRDIGAMSSTEDGSTILAATLLLSGRTILVKLDAKGGIEFSKKLEEGVHIAKIIKTIDNKYLCIGYQKNDSLLMKIDANGEVLWEKINDRGKDDMFIDGILTEDGGFILIENSGKSAQFFLASSEIWLTKYDSKGEKITEKSFQGRHGSIARGKDGNYAIAYDKSGTAKQDIWIKSFDKDLNEKWNTNITSTDFGLESFNVGSLTNGDYIVTGPIFLRPWVSYIDAAGAKKWDFHNKTMEPASGTDFISKDNDCYIISSVVAITDQRITNKVKVIKFQP